jgi:hypothetical protein
MAEDHNDLPANSQEWSLRTITPPWGDRPSIYRYLLNNTPADGTLPDEALVRGDSQFGFAPGALEGMLAHGALEALCELDDVERQEASGDFESALTAGKPFEEPPYVSQVLSALRKMVAAPSHESALALYDLPVRFGAMTAISPILDALDGDSTIPRDRAVEIGGWLVTEAADREAVKFGIGLLCLSHSEEYRDVFLTLGRHEEFTNYAAAALRNTEAEPDRLLWELAQSLYGWGRVALVEQLADTHDPNIKRWMLTEGFDNSVFNDEVVLVCAEAGGLYAALLEPEIDQELFYGIGTIICRLLSPNYNTRMIAEYPTAVHAITQYLRLVQKRELTLESMVVVETISHFLRDRSDALHPSLGWLDQTPELHDIIAVISMCPEWTKLIENGLASDDEQIRRQAEWITWVRESSM